MKKLFLLLVPVFILACNDGSITSKSIGRPPVVLSVQTASPFALGLAGTGTTVEGTITMQVDGGIPATNITATVSAPFGLKGGTYPGTGGTCTDSEVNHTCTIVVVYSPTVIGTDQDDLVISYTAGGVSYQTAITLTGYTQSVLQISDGPTYDYGIKAVGSITDKTLTISRTAGGATATSMGSLNLNAPFTFKGGNFPGTGGTCTSTLASGTCSIVVTYEPTTLSPHSDTITLNYFDGINSTTATRSLAGTGVPPAVLTVNNTGTFNFGIKAVGSQTTLTYTVTYASGGVPATALNATGLSGDFVFRGGSYPGTGGTCGTTLAAGSCTIVVQFTPQQVATLNATMTLAYHDGAFPQIIQRSMTGQGVPPAVLTVSDFPSYNYGLIVTGNSADRTFTVTHASGGVAATSVSVSGVTAPHSFKGGTFPGTGGTCTTTINIGTNCTVVLTYAPVTPGTFTRNASFNYNNGAITTATVVSITGTTQAGLTISDGPTYNYGNKVVGSSTDKTFTIGFAGGNPATLMSPVAIAAPFNYKGGTYPGTGGNCGTTLSTGNCTIVVSYAPSANVTSNSTISINYYDGFNNQTASRNITGTGVSATVLSVSDGPTYSYGSKVVGTATDKIFTVTYSSGTLTATAMTASGLALPFRFKGGTYPGTGGSCSSTLSSGTCTLIVSYSPTTAAAHSSSFNFSYNDGAVTQIINRGVTGTGLAAAVLSISDSGTYNFGSVQTSTSVDKTYTVTYVSGGVAATSLNGAGLAAPFSFKGGTFPGTGGTCGATIAAGTCTIVVTYSPVTAGTYSGSFTFSYNDGATTQNSTRNVSGSTEGSISISDGPTYNYGNVTVGATSTKTFTLTYAGGLSLSGITDAGLAAPYSYAGGSYPGTAGTCGTTMSSGTCTIVVNYSPNAVATHNTTLQLNYNNGFGAASSTRALTGVGIAPALLSFSPATAYDYGSHATGSPNDATFTIAYSGTTAATSLSPIALSAPYAYKGGTYPGTGGTCSTTLSSGSCTIVVTYTPNSASVHNSTVSINYFNGASTQTVSKNLTGTGQALAFLSLSDGPTYNYGTKSVGSTTDKSFTVTNLGSANATSVIGTGLVAPYSFKGGSYPGAGGSCTNTIIIGASCTVIVSYKPTATGVTSSNIQINYHDGSANQSALRGVTGTAAFVLQNKDFLLNFIQTKRNQQANKSQQQGFKLQEISDITFDRVLEFTFIPTDYKTSLQNQISIFDGISKKIHLAIHNPSGQNDFFGASSISVDDFNEDSVEDIAISSPFYSSEVMTASGIVYLFSGYDGSLVRDFKGSIDRASFGSEVYDYVDINGDGVREIVVLDILGNIFVYDGKTGVLLARESL